MKPFEESDRYNYPLLTANSVVFDVGAHDGNFAALIHEKFGCIVEAFEPIPAFFEHCKRRFAGNDKIHLWPFALGAASGRLRFGVKGSMSGEFCTSPNEFVEVPIEDVAWFIEKAPAGMQIGVLKLNCEGGEYAILERLIAKKLIRRIDALQVQFHTVAPDYAERHETIRKTLAKTHDMTFDSPFIWTGWTLRR